MEKAKNTPGPWTADWDDNGQWYVNIGQFSVSGLALRGDSGECVESANARLIALSPEMLEAIEFVEEFFAKLERDTEPDDPLRPLREKYHAPIHNKLRPLIRKAKGE